VQAVVGNYQRRFPEPPPEPGRPAGRERDMRIGDIDDDSWDDPPLLR
jgi:hypothetical protein